jgi:hypothetical protein
MLRASEASFLALGVAKTFLDKLKRFINLQYVDKATKRYVEYLQHILKVEDLTMDALQR